MEHTRAENLRIIPKVGDSFLTNKRRPLLTIIEVHFLPYKQILCDAEFSIASLNYLCTKHKIKGSFAVEQGHAHPEVVNLSRTTAGHLWGS